MRSIIDARIRKVQYELRRRGLTALLVTDTENIAYLTGLRALSRTDREALLILTLKQAKLLLSPLRRISSEQSSKILTLTKAANPFRELMGMLMTLKVRQLALEPRDLSLSEYKVLLGMKRTLPLTDAPQIIEKMRLTKTSDEKERIVTACRITARVMDNVQSLLQPGVTEDSLARRITSLLMTHGADGLPESFTPVVAFGEHSAVPHHVPMDTKLGSHDIALLDFGCQYRGYASDMTRTFLLGSPPHPARKVSGIVRAAYRRALVALTNHPTALEVDSAARGHLRKNGLGKYFIHSTGHGLGLAVHEAPTIGPRSKMRLEPGMVFTIEPGVYLPGKFGMRHEDTVLLTEKGPRVLTRNAPSVSHYTS